MIGRLRNRIDYALYAAAYAFAKFTRSGMSASLTPLPAVERLTPRVVRILGQNPNPFTLQGTNTYLVGTGKKKVLIDAGERNIPAYIEHLREALGDSTLECIVVTHWHEDHVGGVPDVRRLVGDCPVYKLKRAEDAADITHDCTQSGGRLLRLVHTPGHTIDHAVLWLDEERALFSGDCVLGEGTSVFECLHTYMNSLQVLLDLKPTVVFPGHGKVIDDPHTKISEYIAHRLKREEQIVAALERMKSATPMDLTNEIYTEVPWSLKIAAMENVKHHLSKLRKDGRVYETSGAAFELASRATSKPNSNSLDPPCLFMRT
ncbi:Beta-lactamase-like protein 2 [Aphelenchoides fujianensis]|nr:Beta-lactamase-like protein 2 [Aphelenchoides fujianensis]